MNTKLCGCGLEVAKGRTTCKKCWNEIRRSRYNESICKYCSSKFKFEQSKNKIFCSEKCRFMDKVLIDNSSCWMWKGYIQKDGFGTFVRSGHTTNRLAHRVSYELFKENLNETDVIVQNCGNSSCVNHNHLLIKKDILFKICKECNISKDKFIFFDEKYNTCLKCLNKNRRLKYRPSTCGHCEEEYKPIKRGFGKFCSKECRFMDKVKISPKTDCWIWKAHRTKTGYGTFSTPTEKSALAHRESYRIFIGPIHDNMNILHSCDMPFCVNWEHLREGTDLENSQDLKQRGPSNWKKKIKELI